MLLGSDLYHIISSAIKWSKILIVLNTKIQKGINSRREFLYKFLPQLLGLDLHLPRSLSEFSIGLLEFRDSRDEIAVSCPTLGARHLQSHVVLLTTAVVSVALH